MSYKKEWMDSLFYEVVQCWISISRTITQAEWKEIYKEIFALTKKLDLCYVKKFNFQGVEGQCLSHATEDFDEYLGIIYNPEYSRLKIEGLYSKRLAVGPVYNDALYKYCSSIQREE